VPAVSLLTSWTLDPLQLAPVAAIAVAYAVRARTLARRGQPVPWWRIALFALGIVLLLAAVASPLAEVGEEELFSVHMAQHVLLGDLAPLCLLAGLNGPLLQPLLAVLPVRRLRALANPFVALPLWAANLALWHLPFMYEAAVEHSLVHALEHVAFFTAGALFWAPVLEPLPAPRWFGTGAKLLYIVAARFTSMVLANVLAWADEPVYAEYVHEVARFGISARADQGIAGSVMMIVDSVVTIAAIAWLFLKLAGESERRQELIEQGVEPEAAARAVRYGRG
jgi:putative membrane protein